MVPVRNFGYAVGSRDYAEAADTPGPISSDVTPLECSHGSGRSMVSPPDGGSCPTDPLNRGGRSQMTGRNWRCESARGAQRLWYGVQAAGSRETPASPRGHCRPARDTASVQMCDF